MRLFVRLFSFNIIFSEFLCQQNRRKIFCTSYFLKFFAKLLHHFFTFTFTAPKYTSNCFECLISPPEISGSVNPRKLWTMWFQFIKDFFYIFCFISRHITVIEHPIISLTLRMIFSHQINGLIHQF